MKIIIDGYNLIFNVPALNKFATESIEKARTELINKLQNYISKKSAQIILVFDNKDSLSITNNERTTANLKIVYTNQTKNADTKILELLRTTKNTKDTTVVSGDYKDILNRIKPLGVKIMLPKEFYDLITHKQLSSGDEKPQIKSKEEVEEWLEYFSKKE